MTTFSLSTERLWLRPHSMDDAAFMLALNSDPEVIRYTGDSAFGHIDEAKAVIQSLIGQFETRKMGRFVVIEKSTGTKIGWCGLKWHDDRHLADIGYRFMRDTWGKGYATEAAKACLDYGFNELALSRIIARSNADNAASLAVIARLGMVPCGSGQENDFKYLEFEMKRPY